MQKTFYVWLFVCLLPCWLFSPKGNAQNYAYQLQRFSPNEGLSQGDVKKTVQDDLGFIWVATGRGLNRFDGSDFSLYSDPRLQDNNIVTLYKQHNGDLLVSTEVHGLYRIDPRTLTTAQLLDGHMDANDDDIDTVYVIKEDQKGTLWLGIDQSVYSLEPTSGTLTKRFTLEQEEEIIRALEVVGSQLYIGASDGLYRLDLINGRESIVSYLPQASKTPEDRNVKYLHYDDFNGLLVGTVAGLYQLRLDQHMEPLNDTGRELIARLNIWDLVFFKNQAFLATEQGLFLYKTRTNELTRLLRFSESRFSINDNTILDIFPDRTGRLWLASRGQGVFTWSPDAMLFTNIQAKTSIHPGGDLIWSFFQTDDDTMWIGTENGLNRVDLKSGTQTAYLVNPDLKAITGEQSIYTIFSADSGGYAQRMWLFTGSGLRLFDGDKGELLPLPADEDALAVLQSDINGGFIALDAQHLAFFTLNEFYFYDAQKGSIRPIRGLKDKLDPKLTFRFLRPLPDHPDELLITTSGHLYRYNEQTQVLTLIYKVKHYNQQGYDFVENWVLDHANTLWLTVNGEGLVGIDGSTYEERYRIDQTKGLLTHTVYGPMLDPLGNLWFSSHNGLYRLQLNNLQLRQFSVEDGLPANEFNSYANLTLRDGRMAYGSVKGLTLFTPEAFLPSMLSQPPKAPQFTDISLLSRELHYYPNKYDQQELKLNYDDVGLEVKFASFDLVNSTNMHYRVNLEGPSPFMHQRHISKKVFFAKLLPGDYTLSISAYDAERGNYTQPARLNLNVAYPPWRSPFAFSLYGITVILLLLFWYLWHTKQRKALQRAHDDMMHSQQQTQLALSSTHSGIWHFDAEQHQTLQPRLKSELGYTGSADWIAERDFFSLMHPQDIKRIAPRWRAFLRGREQEHWEATFRLRHAAGQWLWYHDIGKFIDNEDKDAPPQVSGIYTNITDNQALTQQARVLGEAVGQINDWLLILDENRRLFSTNQSFLEAFHGNEKGKLHELGIYAFLKALGKKKYTQYMELLAGLKAGQHWRGDDTLVTRYDGAHPVHVSITAAAREGTSETNDEISYYVIVISDLSEQKRAESELRFLANYDPLTRLPNRTLIRKNIEQALVRAQKHHALAALLFIDLDKFKPVNDSFGHAVGDQVLCNICRRIEQHLDDNSVLGRQSGDEFLLLIEKVESPATLREFVTKLTRELAQPIEIAQYNINISASIGVAMSPFDADNAEDLIRNADMAMIHAKQAGRNGFKFFTEQMNNRITQKLLLENALQEAFRGEQLQNYYQPIVNNQLQSMVGVELLLRWEHENRFISPAEFIPVAEEIGLIDAITEQALHRALSELSPWLQQNRQFYVSLNLSPMHILKSNLTERLQLILQTHNVSVDQLRLEITENTLLEDKQKATEQLNRLRAAGFKLFLDDFGTGYSSLTYLSHFPIQVIKIDQSFVSQIGINPSNESIIRTIHTLAKNLGLYCIAEGVETREQISFLSKLGCHNLQGYYYARPTHVAELLSDVFQEELRQRLKMGG